MGKRGRPKKERPLSARIMMRVEPEVLEMFTTAGTVDQWRAWITQEAERRLGYINPNLAGKFPKGNIHDIETR